MEDNFVPVPETPPQPPKPDYTARGRELIFCGGIAVAAVLMANFVLYGGFNLGFALAAAAAILCSWLYLRKAGGKFGRYEKSLLVLSLVIAAGFGRSDDGFVKFVMLNFLFVAVNLSFILAAGQNRRNPDGAASLLDAPRAFYRLGVGSMRKTGSGLVTGFKRGGEATRKFGAVGVGLLVSAPVLVVVILLLTSADAAFEGLMDLMPEIELEEYIHSALWGALLGWILYSRAVALIRGDAPEKAVRKSGRVHPMTINTVLVMVCLVYVAYLVSQLAYLSGGLSGILPEEFTLAEYARRGFFEMAWLCAINLALLCCVLWLIRAEGKLPLVTRIAGTFLGAITIFLVVTASAKMFLYISSYGLTWRRVITEVIMLWLAITTVLITIRLFAPIPYMKAVVLTAIVLGALVLWVDVGTLVANYNVSAYRSGKLETVDVSHLDSLGSAGIPSLIELTGDEDPLVARMARDALVGLGYNREEDFRDWNYTYARAAEQLAQYRAAEEQAVHDLMRIRLCLDTTGGTLSRDRYHTFVMEEGLRYIRIRFTPEEAQVLEEQLTKVGWKKMPLPVTQRILLTGGNALFREFADGYDVPTGSEGWWLFRDLHPDRARESDLHRRKGYRCVLAWYDAEARRLYYLEADTMEAGE